MNTYRKAQATLQYSLLIAVLVGVALIMQVYIRRSMQGRIQLYGDQLGEQYQVADTKDYELYISNVSTNESTTPGWDHPTTSTAVRGSYNSYKKRQLHLW
ncbi:MAG: hypothetical protein M0R48_03835 [Candidatus Omnitrophica bacterium]|nr:hypothetical protein [Candidatus Omnitrophota bacterium]